MVRRKNRKEDNSQNSPLTVAASAAGADTEVRKDSTPGKRTPGLDKLYFGKDDAESDFGRGGLLRDGFLKTQAYEEAINGRKRLVVGRKGSGKSAICLMINAALSSEGRVCLVTPDEISAEEIRRFHLPGIPPEQSKQLIWRYIFDVQVAKYLLSVAKTRLNPEEPLPDEITCVRKFLVDNGETDCLTFGERFWRIIERLKASLSLEAFGVSVGIEVEHPSPGIRANDQLDMLERQVSAVASKLELNEHSEPLHLLVDQIEKIWSNDRDSDSMVVGLLIASGAIQQKFNFVRTTIFLRTDIYAALQFQDRDKLRGEEFHIDWTEDKLLELILARARASSNGAIDVQELWTEIFPSTIEEQPSPSFLVSRTLMRPRDIIQLCNACRDEAKTSRKQRISQQDIRRAMGLYSNWKLSDLQNEWQVNYPFIADVFVLLSNISCYLSRASFEERLQTIQADLAERYPGLGASFSADALLSILYTIGIIGLVRKGSTRYSYQDPASRRVEANERDFAIHPCFRHALGSHSTINTAPYQAIDLQLLRGRFMREERISFQSVKLSAPRRFIHYSVMSLERIESAVVRSGLPDEVRVELRGTIASISNELKTLEHMDSPILSTESLGRAVRYLAQVEESLTRQGLLREKDDLAVSLREFASEQERFLERGVLSEFR